MPARKPAELLVLDASVVAKWFINEPDSDKTLPLLDEASHGRWQLVVPDLLQLELAHIFWKHRQLGYARGQLQRAFKELDLFRLEWMPVASLLQKAIDAAYELEITVYDACYLMTASVLHATLATFDRHMAKRAASLKIPLIQF